MTHTEKLNYNRLQMLDQELNKTWYDMIVKLKVVKANKKQNR